MCKQADVVAKPCLCACDMIHTASILFREDVQSSASMTPWTSALRDAPCAFDPFNSQIRFVKCSIYA